MNTSAAMREALDKHVAGQLMEAQAAYRRVLSVEPQNADALHNLGCIVMGEGRHIEAAELIGKAIAIRPRSAEYRNSLGVALQQEGNHTEAIASFKKAIQRKPDYAQAHANLGDSLLAIGKAGEAIASYRRAIAFEPDDGLVDARLNLAVLLHAEGHLDEAEHSYRRLLEMAPGDAHAHNNLANVLSDLGDAREADLHYRRAIALEPGFVEAHSNLLLNLSYRDDLEADAIFAEHVRFDECHARQLLAEALPHGNLPDPQRRLRIGYVSPDFREHAVARFFEPVLQHHARDEFEIHCYSLHAKVDETTRRLMSLADQWRDLVPLTDAEAAQAIRDDGIDILVDLAGHTAYNRILIFARKPAPVQVTWLGYMCTTGLAAMDYRITDAACDPEALGRSDHTEALLRPAVQWCYRGPREAPDRVRPVSKNGSVTFGSFNNLAKVSESAISMWAQLLLAVPYSRLLVARVPAGKAQHALKDKFQRHGIDPARVTLVGKLPLRDYYALFEQIDVALDTFPYNGTTTTFETLWMGVPVVTLRGNRSIERSGASILGGIGLSALVAGGRGEYVSIAAGLAADPAQLSRLRQVLRQNLLESPFANPKGLASELERLFRMAWGEWCASRSQLRQ